MCRSRLLLLLSLAAMPLSVAMGDVLYTLMSPDEQTAGAFGYAVACVGDVNSDEFPDIIVGAHQEDAAEDPVNAGRAYVFSGFAGAVLYSLSSGNPELDGYFGCSVSGAGDVDGDGCDDILVGAEEEGLWDCDNPAGRAYLFDGQTGELLDTLESPNTSCGRFGHAITGIDDINADGFDDFAVGAYAESYSGRVYVFDGITRELIRIIPGTGGFGWALAAIKDVNNDDVDDLVIGAPNGAQTGRVYIYSGATGSCLHTFASPNWETGGHFGHAVGAADDVDNDGISDVVVGAWREDPGTAPLEAGRAYVFSGESGQLLFSLSSPHEQEDGLFGCSVAGAGDVNGDGVADVIVGARDEAPADAPLRAGRAYLFSGVDGTFLYALASPHQEEFGSFGCSVAGLGDLNNSSRSEVIVGAKWDSPGVSPGYAGRAYVYTFPAGNLSLKGSLEGGELVLQWSAFPGVSAYWVYGAPNKAFFTPGFAPDFQYRLDVLLPEAGTWSSPSGIGAVDENWSYLVLAVSPAGLELSRSNSVGEFDFSTPAP